MLSTSEIFIIFGFAFAYLMGTANPVNLKPYKGQPGTQQRLLRSLVAGMIMLILSFGFILGWFWLLQNL